jgi:hypothetical protein
MEVYSENNGVYTKENYELFVDQEKLKHILNTYSKDQIMNDPYICFSTITLRW